jgi:hypothetical protein
LDSTTGSGATFRSFYTGVAGWGFLIGILLFGQMELFAVIKEKYGKMVNLLVS